MKTNRAARIKFIKYGWIILLILAPSKTEFISRINHGVFYTSEGYILTHSSVWRHTYSIDLPKVDIRMIEEQSCPPSVDNSLNPDCEIKNSIIKNVNWVRTYVHHLVAEIKKKTENIVHSNLHRRSTHGTQSKGRIRRHTYFGNHSTPHMKSRSKRGLFDFLGDAANALFGVATDGEIEDLRGHLNLVSRKVNRNSDNINMIASTLNSYMNKTSHTMNMLARSVEINHEFIDSLINDTKIQRANLYQSRITVTNLLQYYIRKMFGAGKLEHNMDDVLEGITLLMRRKLPPKIITFENIKDTLITVRHKLEKHFPTFKIVSLHPAYYYEQPCLFTYHSEGRLSITINIPVSAAQSHYKLYSVVSLPVPINSTSHDATFIDELPSYIAVSTDEQTFVELTNIEVDRCTGSIMRQCKFPHGIRSVKEPTCALSLLLETDESSEVCNVMVQQKGVKPSLLHLGDGIVLVSGLQETIMTCPNGVTKKRGCQYCMMNIPCSCSLMAGPYYVPASISECQEKDSQQTILYPVNILFLTEMLPQEETKKFLSGTVFPEPVDPKLEYQFEQMFSRTKEKIHELKNIKIKLKTKDDDSLLSYYVSKPTTYLIFSLISFILTSTLSVAVFFLYRKYRQIAIILTALPLTSDAFKIAELPTAATTVFPNAGHLQCPNSESGPNAFLLGLELLSLAFILIIIIKSWRHVVNTALFRTEVILEVAEGSKMVDIYITTLPLCPESYNILMKNWVTGLTISQLTCFRTDLLIQWQDFLIQNKYTGEVVLLPTDIRVGIFNASQLKKILNKHNFFTHLKLQHGGRVVYLNKARTASVRQN